MSLVQIILVVIVAFIIGCSSVNDQIETYQPVVACSLIGLVTGHLELGVMLGGSLQLITSGWANVGAAMAPDASLAAVALGYPAERIQTDVNLYLVSAGRMLKTLCRLSNEINSCLLVGHNPGLTDLINLLNVRIDNLPTGSAACFNFKTDLWSEISAGNARFQWLQLAREL